MNYGDCHVLDRVTAMTMVRGYSHAWLNLRHCVRCHPPHCVHSLQCRCGSQHYVQLFPTACLHCITIACNFRQKIVVEANQTNKPFKTVFFFSATINQYTVHNHALPQYPYTNFLWYVAIRILEVP